MPGTVVQELLRILRSRKRNGERSVWLSTVNQEALRQLASGRAPRAAVQAAPRPAPAPLQTAVPAPDLARQTAQPADPPLQNRPMPGTASATPTPGAPPPPARSARPPEATPAPRPQKREPISGDYQSCASFDLNQLASAVENCRKCQLCQKTPHGILGEGVPGSRLMFIGGHAGSAAPDTEAGTMLTNIIAAMKLQRGGTDPRTGVYVTTVLKCSAADHRLTDSREVESCMGYLRRQIELVHPQYIVLLGALPMRCLLGMVNIQKFHGQWFQYENIPVLPVYEPEYVLRFKHQQSFFMKYKREIWNDLKLVMKKMNAAE